MNMNNLQDAEVFEKHFVTPLVDALRAEIKPLVVEVTILKGKVARLEANQAKALVGWTILVGGVSLFLDQAKTWIWSHLHKS